MSIPSRVLASWANPVDDRLVAPTVEAFTRLLRNRLPRHLAAVVDVYVQGSWATGTAVDRHGDVDLVVELRRPAVVDWQIGDLPAWQELDEALQHVCRAEFGSERLSVGDKALRVVAGVDTLRVDLLPALTLARHDIWPGPQKRAAITFLDRRQARWWTSNPRQRVGAVFEKEQRTGEGYRRMVRIFKHAARQGDGVPSLGRRWTSSFRIESLIYHAPDRLFGGDLGRSYREIVDWFLRLEPAQLGRLPLIDGMDNGPQGVEWRGWLHDEAVESLYHLREVWHGNGRERQTRRAVRFRLPGFGLSRRGDTTRTNGAVEAVIHSGEELLRRRTSGDLYWTQQLTHFNNALDVALELPPSDQLRAHLRTLRRKSVRLTEGLDERSFRSDLMALRDIAAKKG